MRGDGLGDAPGFIGSQVVVTERPFLKVISVIHSNQPEAVGVEDLEAVGPGLLDPPWRWETTFWRH
jgi:hypothetical protein